MRLGVIGGYMRYSQKNDGDSHNNSPNFIKKTIHYGIPVLTVVLVIAVFATSFLTQSNAINVAFGKVNKDEVKGDLSNIVDEETERQKNDAIEIQSKAKGNLTSTSLSEIVDKENSSIKKSALKVRQVEPEPQPESAPESKVQVVLEIKAEAQSKPISEVKVAEASDVPNVEEPVIEDGLPQETQEEVVAEEIEEEPEPLQESESQNSEFVETWVEKYVNTDILNIRNLPGFNAETMGTLQRGDLVTEVSTNHEWSKILMPDESEAFVYNYYLTTEVVEPVVEPEPEEPVEESSFESVSGVKYIAVGAANVRADASTGSDKLTTLHYGSAVELTGYANGWYQILSNDGHSGYVREDLLRDDPVPQEELEELHSVAEENFETEDSVVEETPAPVETVAPGNSGGAAAASIAAAQAGVKPYVYGAAGPNAFDCSGLVQYAVINAGGYISRSTATQIYDGIAVPFGYGDYSQLVPGDVLLFAFGGGGVSHAGMYLGNGSFVHAMNPASGIQINSLSGNWAGSLAYVRRVFY